MSSNSQQGPGAGARAGATQALRSSILPTYGRYDVTLVKGEGSRVWDDAGTCYLDCIAGIAVIALGHCNPVVRAAAEEQLGTLWHVSNLYWTEPMLKLARKLSDRFGGAQVFYCNSGAEGTEAALKYARKATGKPGFVALEGSFHGRTFGALSVTGQPAKRAAFEPGVPGASFVRINDTDALAQAVGPDTGAIILEPIQGEGGINVPAKGYLKAVRKLTAERGILLILDEVQTGMGRTGRMFACEHENVVPDIICLAKALGGGVMPIGAFMASAKIWKVLEPNPSIHNSTFGGNPLACTAASATIEVLCDEHLPARAAVMGNYFMRRLSELKAKYPSMIGDVRGMGLLIGLEFKTAELRQAVQVELFHRGVLVAGTMNSNKTFRIEPPLIITESQIAFMVDTLQSILAEFSQEDIETLSPARKKRAAGAKRARAKGKSPSQTRLAPVKGAKTIKGKSAKADKQSKRIKK